MIPFIDGRLVALGPWIVPALIVGLVAVACLAGSLIERGLHERNWWRVALGVGVAAYPVAVACAAAGLIR